MLLQLLGGVRQGVQASSILHGFRLGSVIRSTGLHYSCGKQIAWNAPCVSFLSRRTMYSCSISQPTQLLHGSQKMCNTPRMTLPLHCSQNVRNDPLCVPSRTIFWKWQRKPAHLQPQNARDGLSQDFTLIYAQKDINYFRIGIPVLLICVTLTSAILIMLLYNNLVHGKPLKPLKLHRGDVENPFRVFCVYLAAAPFFILFILKVFRTLVHRMYYNPTTKQYAASILKYTLFKETVKFVEKDIKMVPVTIFLGGNTMIKGRRCSTTEDDFTSVVHYNRFMGYDIMREREHQQGDFSIIDLGEISQTVRDQRREERKRKEKMFVKKFTQKRKLKKGSDY